MLDKKIKLLKELRKNQSKNTFWEKHKTYDNYLKSDEWKNVKNIFKKSNKPKCQMCGTNKKIHVHHLSYYRLGTPSEIKDLSYFCAYHHKKIHEIQKKHSISIQEATNKLLKSKKIIKIKKSKRKDKLEKLNQIKKAQQEKIIKNKILKKEALMIKTALSKRGITVYTKNINILKQIKSKHPEWFV